MEDLCGEIPFWNQSLTWDTKLPTFTKCFRRTIFILAPSFIFWFIYPFYIWHLGRETKSTSRKCSKLSMVKTLFAVFLSCLAIIDLVNWTLNGDEIVLDWLDPLARLLNSILIIALVKVRKLIQYYYFHFAFVYLTSEGFSPK